MYVKFVKCPNFYLLKRFPFDWKNPIGYLLAITVEYIILAYECFVVACILALAFGGYWFVITGTEEIQCILHLIDDKSQSKKNESNELKALFAEFVDMHAFTKQLSIN